MTKRSAARPAHGSDCALFGPAWLSGRRSGIWIGAQSTTLGTTASGQKLIGVRSAPPDLAGAFRWSIAAFRMAERHRQTSFN
jgi:hypothetical protein